MTTEAQTKAAGSRNLAVLQAQIKRTLQVFHRAGDVVEIRAINALPPRHNRTCTVAGYFDDLEKAALNAAQLELTAKPEGIYFVLNEVNRELLARQANGLAVYPKHTTSDGEVVRRRWLLVDLDPRRPSGISSTDAELDASKQLATDVKTHLCDRMEWPAPVEALSGNGIHLLFPIDMPNAPESRDLVKGTLAGLAAAFGSSAVAIDTCVFNAARITKLYGTWARKGSDVPGRPHRQSTLLYVPEYLESHPEREDANVGSAESRVA